MTKLADYLTEHGISRREFAAQIGIDPSVVSRFCAGHVRPGLATAVAIERETGGAVPASSWIEGASQ